MAHDLKPFMTKVLDIKPLYGDVVSNGIPGMAMPNMGADVVNDLRKVTLDFARVYSDPSSNYHLVQRLSKDTEGAIMAAVTVGVLPEKTADLLIDMLHEITGQGPVGPESPESIKHTGV